MEGNNKKKRDSGIELLRIIAILMVIGVHIFIGGNYYNCAVKVGGHVERISSWIRLLYRPAVNIFILITGYFMVKMRFDLKKAYKRVLKVYLTVLFYSVLLSVLALILGSKYYTVDGTRDDVVGIVLRMIFPVLSQRWYFITNYILLCIFAPFLNIVLQNIKKQDYKILLVLTSFVMSGWFFLSNIRELDRIVNLYGFADLEEGKNLFSFMYIYIIGGYIRLHCVKNERAKVKYLMGALVCLVINIMLESPMLAWLELDDITTKYTNPLVIVMAVCMLLYFKDLHFYNRFVNMLASTTIGVYAIHEFRYVKELIWNMFDFTKVDCSNMFLNIVYIISIGAMIFGVCAVIDLGRQKLFKFIEDIHNRNRRITSQAIKETEN